MTKTIVFVTLFLVAFGTSAQERACGLAAVDGAETAIAVSGEIAAEANPLITSPAALVVSVVIRCEAAAYINTLPEPERTVNRHVFEAANVGIVVSNAVVIVGAVIGHAVAWPVSIGIGAVVGYRDWLAGADKREFMRECVHQRIESPKLVCAYSNH